MPFSKEKEAVVHKAIHRYTVRAKAGGSQSAADSGKKIKSVGSSLRRYGEQRLAEEIKELLTEKWADQLADCELILVSVSKRNEVHLAWHREGSISSGDPPNSQIALHDWKAYL